MARWCRPVNRSVSAADTCWSVVANTAFMRWCKKRSQCPARRTP
ncbi:coat protein [Xanthomonas vasicola pv. vasculorum]|nr:coat protein [Xanthomonas vasicola pv. vasculorum]TWQ32005.1 coat protein [Xanthomonas vasicola]RNK42156.1 coat protein [Xanthomonas vasicola pv. vasculorum]RNK44763.1 coat protein [Xanthomonas vasicola pv. vasculorum]RNK50180.1 coat protein [Xanthomonas vasicola pv. vasculorum]